MVGRSAVAFLAVTKARLNHEKRDDLKKQPRPVKNK